MKVSAVLLGMLLSAATLQSVADVRLQEKVSVEGAGFMSFANMSGTSTVSISGQKARTDSDLQMQSRLVRVFARGMGPRSDIVLLEADRVYEIDAKKKQYREISLSDQRAQLQKALSERSKTGADAQPSPTGMDESQCDWSEPKVDVKKPGNHATIATFDAQEVTIVARQSCTDRKSGAVCDVALSLDEWIAPGFDAGDEARQFNLAYAKQLGLQSPADESLSRAQALFGRYQGAWGKVMEQMRAMKGYPVKSTFALGLGGAACKDKDKGDAGTASSAGTDSSSAGSGASAASSSGLGAQLVGALFSRKKQPEEAAAPQTQAPVSGMEDLFVPVRVHSEMVSASHDPLPPETFQVPAGFRKTGG
ncbi:MAG TPA: hypothetical protein VGM84_27565 [Steroidobacteraceae bacterium]|jgi:hypothetical protein